MITDLLVHQIESCLLYEPNREQSELLQQLAAFVLDGRDDSLFLLRGYMRELVKPHWWELWSKP